MRPVIINNDIFFNRTTVEVLDSKAAEIIMKIDGAEMIDKYTIQSKFDGNTLNIDKLSTGCKTALNIFYNPNNVFDIRECGDNALDLIYTLPSGNICCDYPLISFDMTTANVCDKNGLRSVTDYEELKEWWIGED